MFGSHIPHKDKVQLFHIVTLQNRDEDNYLVRKALDFLQNEALLSFLNTGGFSTIKLHSTKGHEGLMGGY